MRLTRIRSQTYHRHLDRAVPTSRNRFLRKVLIWTHSPSRAVQGSLWERQLTSVGHGNLNRLLSFPTLQHSLHYLHTLLHTCSRRAVLPHVFFFLKSEKREVNVELLRGRRFRQLWRQIQIIVENIYIFFLLTTFKKPNACFAINIFTFAASCRTPFIWRPRSVRRNDQMCSCSAGTKTRRIERIGRLYLKVLAESFQSPLRADRKALRWKTDCLRSKNRRKDAEWEKEKETTSTRGQYGHRHLKTNLALERITLFLTS